MPTKLTYHRNGRITPKSDPSLLTDRERLFIREYLVDMNQTAAAKRVGLKNPSTSAGRMLKLPKVQKAILAAINQRADKLEITGEKVLQELAYSVFRDPLDLCDPKTGQLIVNDMRQIPKRMRSCIEGIEVDAFQNPETGEVRQKMKVKLTSKMAAMELAMKHLGLIEPVAQNVKVTVDWDRMYENGAGKPLNSPIEEKIRQVRALADNREVIDVESTPVTQNGNV